MNEIVIDGSKLKTMRDKMKISQKTLAELSFVSARKIADLEKTGKAKLGTLKLLSLILMCDPEDLIK
jgi:predicted transcriptional regulator